MGVQGLWQLVESAGRPVPLETLENKILAVDISIWLNQALKGFRDAQGGPLSNAHVLGLFHRICKLLFYKIKPVFVFDGGVPQLKKQTLIARHQRRTESQEGISRAQQKLLANYVKRRMLGKIKNISATIKSRSNKYQDDMFRLPPAPGFLNIEDGDEKPDEWHLHCAQREMFFNRYLDMKVVDSEDFKALPPEIRYEILMTLKESRKLRDRIDDMPEESSNFSSYQMNKLLKKRNLQQKIEETQKEMNTTMSKLGGFFYDEDDEEAMAEVRRIASEDFHHFILLRNKKKEEEESKQSETGDQEETSKSEVSKNLSSDVKDEDYLLKLYREDPVAYSKIILKEESKKEKSSGKEEQERKNQDEMFAGEALSKSGTSDLTEEEYLLKLYKQDPLSYSETVLNKEFAKASSAGKEDMSFNTDNNVVKNNLSSMLQNEVIDVESDSDVVLVEREVIDLTTNDERASSSHLSVDHDSELIIDTEHEVTETALKNLSEKNIERDTVTECPSTSYFKSKDQSDNDDEEVELNHQLYSGHSSNKKLENDRAEVILSSNSESITEQSEKLNIISLVDKREIISNALKECDVPEDINKNKSPGSLEENRDAQSETPQQLSKSDDDLSEIECIKDFIRKTGVNNQLEPNKSEPKADITVNVSQTSDDDPFSDVFSNKATTSKETELNSFPYTEEEIEMLDQELEEDQEELTLMRNKLERQTATVADHMYKECQDLLRLFGIPYVVSPMEAEAQCAQLELLGLTHGSITDDSDIWLFGGSQVYKNFFSQGKYVEYFKATDIFSHFGLNREKMIAFAMLTGSDYTVGVEGIGPVTAMEIFSEFPSMNGMDTLLKFKDWLSLAKQQKALPGTPTKAKLIRFELDEGFPSEVIYGAYLNPTVDSSRELFSWGMPSLAELREYAIEKFGWTKAKADELLLPVLKKVNDRQAQLRIDSFFSVNLQKKEKLFPSKRLQSAVRKLTARSYSSGPTREGVGSISEDELSETTPKKSKPSNDAKGKKVPIGKANASANLDSKNTNLQSSKSGKNSRTNRGRGGKSSKTYRSRMASKKLQKEVNLSESSDSS